MRKTKLVEVRVWYHGGYVKITVTHWFYRSISTMITNIHLIKNSIWLKILH
jgi:hypothetical protein